MARRGVIYLVEHVCAFCFTTIGAIFYIKISFNLNLILVVDIWTCSEYTAPTIEHHPMKTFFCWPYESLSKALLMFRNSTYCFLHIGVKCYETNHDLFLNAINRLEVESAPAVVFLKDPGVKPVVHHGMLLSLFAFMLHLVVQFSDFQLMRKFCPIAGTFNNSWFLNLIEQNKYQGWVINLQ